MQRLVRDCAPRTLVIRQGPSVGSGDLIGKTTDPEGFCQQIHNEEWRQFLAGMKLGDFDGIA